MNNNPNNSADDNMNNDVINHTDTDSENNPNSAIDNAHEINNINSVEEDNKDSEDNIDDILDILQKKKADEIKNNEHSNDAPTRIDNIATGAITAKAPLPDVKPEPKPQPKPVTQSKPKTSVYARGAQGGISLDDFDELVVKKVEPQDKKKKKKRHLPGGLKVLIYLICVITVSVVLSVTAIKVGNDVFAFVKEDKEITINIKKNATIHDVAKELEEKGVIKYPSIYKIYSGLRMDGKSYYTGDFISGKHVLNSNFGYDKIISLLAESAYSTEIVRVTIPEGYTVYEIIDLFVEKRVIPKDKVDEFKEKLNTAVYDYAFLEDFNKIKDENGKIESERFYLLEGYLFPDTYDFYVGENLDSIITKFLDNFNSKFEEAYFERCLELGLTVDEVVTLASMIEAEGDNAEDFYKISSVFHNRLNHAGAYPFLDSDAATLYSFQGEKKKLDAGDNQSRQHPYNTYLNKGLPPGAICNPGTEALHAALYPEQTNFYFFYTNSNGETIFSNKFNDHINAYN